MSYIVRWHLGQLIITVAGCVALSGCQAEQPAAIVKTDAVAGATGDAGIGQDIAESTPAAAKAKLGYDDIVRRAIMEGPWGEPALLQGALAPKGDMHCSPTAISAKSPGFTITLPAHLDARRHSLVAISPAGGVLELYTPVDVTVEQGDIIIPNTDITWDKVRSNNRFTLSADAFDGLPPGEERPTGVFLVAGTYVLALTDGVDRQIMKANGVTPQVYAACTIQWTP